MSRIVSITTTVQGGMRWDARRAARRLAWERLARSLPILRILEPPQQLIRPEPLPGQHFVIGGGKLDRVGGLTD